MVAQQTNTPTSTIFLQNCVEGMKQYPNKYFDLAIVDPPYGIGEDGKKNHTRGTLAKPTLYTPKQWDKAPPKKAYFDELFRVSKNQIIFGANHFIAKMPKNSPSWIVWDKENGSNDFADCELAWTSFKTAVRMFHFKWAGMLQGDMKNKETRIHPTQKPIRLYDWLLTNYAKPNDLILDTHLGSGSSRIAAYKNGHNFIGFELDEEYYAAQEKRFQRFIAQQRLW